MKDYARACKIIIFIIVFMLFTYFAHAQYTAMNQWQNAQYRKIEIMLDSMTDSCYYKRMEGTPTRTNPEGHGGASPSISLHQ